MKQQLVHLFRGLYIIIPLKKYIFLLIRIMYTPNKRMINQLFFGGKFKVKTDAYEFFMSGHNKRGLSIENMLFWNYKNPQNSWEKQTHQIWTVLAKKAKVVLDIGANTGYYSILSKAINPNCKVLGFEPIPHIYSWYRENCSINNFDIKCYNQALAEKKGETEIFLENSKNNIYSASLSEEFAASHSSKKVYPVKIQCNTLENIIEENSLSEINIMKIDVEGYEAEVLKGMGQYLQKFKPSLFIEVLSEDLGEKLTELLLPLGYMFFNLNKGDKPKLNKTITVSEDFNYFICQPSVAIELNLT